MHQQSEVSCPPKWRKTAQLSCSILYLTTSFPLFPSVKMLFRVSTVIALSALLCTVQADDEVVHFEPPEEEDVVNPPSLCFINGEGFGGTLTDSFFTVSYYYEMEYIKGGDSTDELISSFERDTTNFLLQSDLFDLPCSQVISRQDLSPAQGISANPEDLVLEGIECSDIEVEANGSTDCVVVSGEFQVYYIDDGSSTDTLESEFKKKIEDGINDGEVTISNSDIREVVSVSEPNGTRGPGDGAKGPDDISTKGDNDGNSTPIIIGATIGALLVLGAAALYRRRKLGDGEETPDPATASEV
eukprot:scaffold1734_cov196-Cylindrotheca_fusiformis.AAC.3